MHRIRYHFPSYVATAAFATTQVTNARSSAQIEKRTSWKMYNELGSGAYGTVRLGMCQDTGQVAAIKVIDSKRCKPEALKRELNVLRKLQDLGGHANILELKDVFLDGSKMCLVTELVSGGELFHHIVQYGAYSEAQAACVVREVAEALDFMHTNGMVHQDVKPENILLCSSKNEQNHRIKLVDFGSSAAVHEPHEEATGTSAYWPPEHIDGPRTGTPASDMWALGCVLYIMLSGQHPFDHDGEATDEEMLERIKRGSVEFDHPVWISVSEEAKRLVKTLLQLNPKERCSTRDILTHPWILRFN